MLSPKSAGLAVKNGFTNVKVFMDGEPGWVKAEKYLEVSPKQLKEGNILLIDLRSTDKYAAGHMAKAINIPLDVLKSKYKEANLPEYKGAAIVLTSDKAADIESAMDYLGNMSFNKLTMFTGGMERWKKAEIPVATGVTVAPAKLTYVRKLEAFEVSIPDFMKAVDNGSALIIDARSASEVAGGKFKSAVNIPSEEMEKRFAEVPKDKPVYVHCATGARAEMAYDILKGKGYTNVKLLKANIEFNGAKAKVTE